MTEKISVALIGAGSMGGALLRGWTGGGVIDGAASAIFDPAPSESIREIARAAGLATNPPIGARRFDALVIAVKPQAAAESLPAYAALAADAVAISVMAGKSVATIAATLAGARRIVRAMPNLPAAVGEGATALFAPATVNAEDRAVAEKLMRAVGAAIWVDNEDAIDLATAVSGSGPAYFFLLAESLADAGAARGLSRRDAETLARATLQGAGVFAKADARSLADLREAVTSPGGTTQAALGVLDGDDAALRRLVAEAVDAARRRARALTS